MKLEEFNYELPIELIAQHPIEKRDESRLMVLDRVTRKIEHKKFKDIIDYLNPGDCLVINDTKVIPARIYGVKKYEEENNTPCKVEVLLLKDLGNDTWETLVKPGRRLQEGAKITFGDGILEAEVLNILSDGNRIIKFTYEGIFNEILDKIGVMPLPPYIKEELENTEKFLNQVSDYSYSLSRKNIYNESLTDEDLKNALTDLNKAVELDPKFIDALYSIAIIEKKLGKYQNAIKAAFIYYKRYII